MNSSFAENDGLEMENSNDNEARVFLAIHDPSE